MDVASVVWAHGAPAAGAATQDLLVAGFVGLALLAGAVLFSRAHRSGRTRVLTSLGSVAERVSGMPAWAALPAAIVGGSLLVAASGFYWDVATHIDNGRDPGPFANPSHFLIIFGLLGIAGAGLAGILLGTGAERPTSIRLSQGWNAPLGAVLLLLCGVVAVLGFPLDDVWHRLFGQDVTLWGPTHIQMVGGAALSPLALWILLVEGQRTRASSGVQEPARLQRAAEILAAGAFLIGLSAFQAEFDYSVPQFRLLFHPVLLMLAAATAFVPARIRLGRGGALGALLVFLAVRSALSAVIGPVLGHTMLHFPLFVAEALAVELVGRRVSTDRQISFGAWSGTAIAVLGLPSEWAWSHLWMTMSWPAELLPETLLLGLTAALAGGLLGGFIGRSLVSPARPRQRAPRWLGGVTVAALVACLAYPLPISRGIDATARVALDTPEESSSKVTVTLDPVSAASSATWFNVTSWQGGGSVIAELRPAGPASYTTDRPVPIEGEWKTLIRLHEGAAIVAAPIYLPEDRAISASEIPAEPVSTRAFVADKKLLLREAKDTPGWLSAVAYALLVVLVAVWVVALGWGFRRLLPDGEPLIVRVDSKNTAIT